jgi:hypothetical protein
MKKEKLPAGTKVRITGNSNAHGFKIGDIVTISGEYAGPTDGFGYTAYRCDEYVVRDYDMEVVKEETLLEQAKRLYPIGTKFRTSKTGVLRTVASTITVYTKSPLILACETEESYRWSEVYTEGKWGEIITETKTDIVMSTTQTATRAQLKSIHSKVCSKWQSRIEETIKLDMFADSFEIPNGLITQAFDEADKDQAALLLEIFTKPDNGYVTLATGDDFNANVFGTDKIVIGKGAVSKEFRGKSIIFDSSKYEAIIMPNPQRTSYRDTMIVFKHK